MVVTDRLIPFLAAFVGLVALGGGVAVQMTAETRTQRLAAEIAALRDAVDSLAGKLPETAAAPADAGAAAIEQANGTIEALLALQERMDRLEAEWASSATVAAGPAPGASAPFSAAAEGATAAIDPNWPTENCIPLGTRFMASVGDELAICQSPVVVKVRAITADNVMIEDTGLITETAFKPIPGSNCQLTVYSADAEGFAELRVSCT